MVDRRSKQVLIVQGLCDVAAPVGNGRLLKDELGERRTLVELPDIGHAMPVEDPHACAQADTGVSAETAMSTQLGRRGFLATTAALAAPRLAASAEQRVLKFVPQADLAAVDPYSPRPTSRATTDTWCSTRCTAWMNTSDPQSQMVAGHSVDADKKAWTLTLRDGLMFHDGTPVLARDAVASIKRWGRRSIRSARR